MVVGTSKLRFIQLRGIASGEELRYNYMCRCSLEDAQKIFKTVFLTLNSICLDYAAIEVLEIDQNELLPDLATNVGSGIGVIL